jgi:predicted O-methyltransferase YrrM
MHHRRCCGSLPHKQVGVKMSRSKDVTSRSNFLRGLAFRLRLHWTRQQLGRVDFSSGLGDGAWLLYGICRSVKPAVAVEIGSARGKSACYIGMALKENGWGRLYAIDPHKLTNWNDSDSIDTYDIMRSHLKNLGLMKIVTIVREQSAKALVHVPTPIDLLFIDGDHSHDGVKADWDSFTPHMSPFGVVVFHDTIWDLNPDDKWYRSDMGVPRFVEELRRQGYPVITIDRDCGISIVQAKRGGIPLDRKNSD